MAVSGMQFSVRFNFTKTVDYLVTSDELCSTTFSNPIVGYPLLGVWH